MSLKLPAFYLYCAGQLVYYVRGEFEESLSISPLPLRSHYCVMVTVLANRPVPPISFPSYITTALLGIGELVWVWLQLLSLSLLMLIRKKVSLALAHARLCKTAFQRQKMYGWLRGGTANKYPSTFNVFLHIQCNFTWICCQGGSIFFCKGIIWRLLFVRAWRMVKPTIGIGLYAQWLPNWKSHTFC